MNIAIVSVFNVSLLEKYVYPEYKEQVRRLDSNFTPAVANLVLELLRKNQNIIIFTQDIKANKEKIFHGERVSIYVAPKISKYKNALSLGYSTCHAIKKLFRLHKGPIDVVSAHWTREYAIAANAFINKIPVFVTIRDIMPNIISRVKSDRLRWRLIWLQNEYVLRKKGYRYIANSDYTAQEVKRLWGHNVPVIPNSVSIFDNQQIAKTKKHNCPNEIKIATISLAEINNKWKNIPTLLKAFSIFREKYPDSVLSMVGTCFVEDNEQVAEYRESGLLDGVKLMGRKSPEEIQKILLESTMMVHPSYEETFGNTLIEALACGVPVVGGKQSGAVPWVLGHGKFGYLCDVSSPNEIADTMQYIIEHYDEALKKGLDGKEKCETKYSSDNVAEEYLNLFQSATKA